MVITMAKLRMAHASTHGARKPPGPIKYVGKFNELFPSDRLKLVLHLRRLPKSAKSQLAPKFQNCVSNFISLSPITNFKLNWMCQCVTLSIRCVPIFSAFNGMSSTYATLCSVPLHYAIEHRTTVYKITRLRPRMHGITDIMFCRESNGL